VRPALLAPCPPYLPWQMLMCPALNRSARQMLMCDASLYSCSGLQGYSSGIGRQTRAGADAVMAEATPSHRQANWPRT
jgi:hypothetical protein